MNSNPNNKMTFLSSKYSNEELSKMGVLIRRELTCRLIDKDNPHFINYHINDMMTDIQLPRERYEPRLHLIESAVSVTNPKLIEMEIMIFDSPNSRDRYIIKNYESFKMEDPRNKEEIIHNPLVMTYFN